MTGEKPPRGHYFRPLVDMEASFTHGPHAAFKLLKFKATGIILSCFRFVGKCECIHADASPISQADFREEFQPPCLLSSV